MRLWTIALTVLFVAGMLGGCGLFQRRGEEWQPATTRSTMSDAAETSTAPATTTQPPAETYVEPARPWGSETRDNLVPNP